MLKIIKDLSKYLTVCIFFYNCTSSKNNYSYSIVSYAIDSTKHFISSSNLISYDDYVFEFITTRKFEIIIQGETKIKDETVGYDTTCVYVLSKNDKLYFQFDTFSLKNNIVQIGKKIDKAYGEKFGVVLENSKPQSDSFLFERPKSLILNNIECYYSDIIPKSKTNNRTTQRMFLIKNKKFNSLYKLNGLKFTDSQYCIIGYSIFNLKQKEGFSQEIETLRKLTDNETNICKSMIMKKKSCVTDTIKGIKNLDMIGY